MAWNQPGGNGGRDPWGNRGGQQGPPDLDEVLKKAAVAPRPHLWWPIRRRWWWRFQPPRRQPDRRGDYRRSPGRCLGSSRLLHRRPGRGSRGPALRRVPHHQRSGPALGALLHRQGREDQRPADSQPGNRFPQYRWLPEFRRPRIVDAHRRREHHRYQVFHSVPCQRRPRLSFQCAGAGIDLAPGDGKRRA